MKFEADCDSSGNYIPVSSFVIKQPSQAKNHTPATTSTNTGSAEVIGEDDSSDDGDGGDDSEPAHSRQQLATRDYFKNPIQVHKSSIQYFTKKDRSSLSKLLDRGWAMLI